MSRLAAAITCVALCAAPMTARADEKVADAEASTADGGADGKLIGGIAAIAVGVGALAGSIYATVRVAELNEDVGFQVYRSEVPIGSDACDLARDGVEVDAPEGAAFAGDVAKLCDEADTLTVVQAVGYPLAALATGIAMYLIATSPTVTEARRVQLLPRVGLEGGGLDVVVRF